MISFMELIVQTGKTLVTCRRSALAGCDRGLIYLIYIEFTHPGVVSLDLFPPGLYTNKSM